MKKEINLHKGKCPNGYQNRPFEWHKNCGKNCPRSIEYKSFLNNSSIKEQIIEILSQYDIHFMLLKRSG